MTARARVWAEVLAEAGAVVVRDRGDRAGGVVPGGARGAPMDSG